MAAGLIDSLPKEDHPDRQQQEEVARNVCSIAYFGNCLHISPISIPDFEFDRWL